MRFTTKAALFALAALRAKSVLGADVADVPSADAEAMDDELAFAYHDNYIYFTFDGSASKASFVSGSYTIKEHSVTGGQDPDNHIIDGSVRNWTGNNGGITFSVGRKGSGDVANWWKDRIRTDQNTFGHDPGELNFALGGTYVLTLSTGTFTFQDVYIAQGHSGSSNNWWFGGMNCYIDTEHTTQCVSDEGVWVGFLRGDNDVNEIKVVTET